MNPEIIEIQKRLLAEGCGDRKKLNELVNEAQVLENRLLKAGMRIEEIWSQYADAQLWLSEWLEQERREYSCL